MSGGPRAEQHTGFAHFRQVCARRLDNDGYWQVNNAVYSSVTARLRSVIAEERRLELIVAH